MSKFRAGCAAGLVMCLTAATLGQVTEKKTLTLEGARKVMAAAESEAQRLGATCAIAIVDDGGMVMHVVRMDGAFPYGATVASGKARTSALFRKPTKVFEDIINQGRYTMVTIDGFTPLQGGVPIVVDGAVVGAIGVSGAASAQQDEEIALAGVKAVGTLAGTTAAPAAGQEAQAAQAVRTAGAEPDTATTASAGQAAAVHQSTNTPCCRP